MKKISEVLKRIETSATVLDGIKVGESRKSNPFGSRASTAPKGFYFNDGGTFGFMVGNNSYPTGTIPHNAIIYSDGDPTHSLFMYDKESNTFIAKTQALGDYSSYDSRALTQYFLDRVKSISEKEAKELIEKDKGTFEGTADEIISYLETAEPKARFRIQKI